MKEPERAARLLARIVGGTAAPFPVLDGAWVCFFSSAAWGGDFVEFYPLEARLERRAEGAGFGRVVSSDERWSGAHLNVSVPLSRDELERRCREAGVPHVWRGGQALLEAWIEDRLLVECVPRSS